MGMNPCDDVDITICRVLTWGAFPVLQQALPDGEVAVRWASGTECFHKSHSMLYCSLVTPLP